MRFHLSALMLLLPIPLLLSLILGLISLALPLVGIYILYRVFRRVQRRPAEIVRTRGTDGHQVVVSSRPQVSDRLVEPATALLLVFGIVLVLLAFQGRHVVGMFFPEGNDEPQQARSGTVRYITGAHGTKLRTESYGPEGAPVLVLTHGWGTNSTEWYYAKRQLTPQFRLIVWDEGGLGDSAGPSDNDYSLERMASDLKSVLQVANNKPVILVGHSIGGMINLTFCRMYPELLGKQVTGIVQVDTSYTNPVRTTKGAETSEKLQKPVGEPILHAMTVLSPVVRLMNWFSYENGSAYIMNAQSSFAGTETRGQLDLVSWYQVESSPAVVARGTLGMFHWDATPVLPQIHVPVLIIVGQQDTTTLPQASDFMKANISQSTLKVVGPAAHYALLERNREVNQAIASFAESLSASKSAAILGSEQ